MRKFILLPLVICLFGMKDPDRKVFQPAGYVFCPAGYYSTAPREMDSFGFSGRITAFWMKETEVSNEEYQEFLQDLFERGRFTEHDLAYPDTALIRKNLWVGRYVNYFTHPYFKDHPVVGITAVQAMKYCEWFTLDYLKDHPDFMSDFRLPTQIEMQYAAQAGINARIYPWNSASILSPCDRLLANFNIRENGIPIEDHAAQDRYYFTNFSNQNSILFFDKYKNNKPLHGVPNRVNKFFPNDWGLYNIVGNVAEFAYNYPDTTYLPFGGSFRTSAEYLNLRNFSNHPWPGSEARTDVGFRPVMTYISNYRK